jgi:hypothetical protein
LPMERQREWPTFAEGEAFRKAVQLYCVAFPEAAIISSPARKCPDCGKGVLGPRERYCARCRNRRRRATNAQNQRNWQKRAAHPNTVKQNGSSLRAASQGTNSNTCYGDTAQSFLSPKLYYGKEGEK